MSCHCQGKLAPARNTCRYEEFWKWYKCRSSWVPIVWRDSKRSISDPEGPNAAGRDTFHSWHWLHSHWNLVTRTKKRRRRWAGGIKRRRAFCWWKNPNCYKFFFLKNMKKLVKSSQYEVLVISIFTPSGNWKNDKKRFPHLELKSYGKHWTTKRLSQTSLTNNY